jgi:hypothetical protein
MTWQAPSKDRASEIRTFFALEQINNPTVDAFGNGNDLG